MNGIGRENIKGGLISIIRWFIGAFFLIMCLGAFLEHSYTAVLLFLLATIISIPMTAKKLENRFNVKMSGVVRFLVLFVLLIAAASALPPGTNTSVNNSTKLVASPPSSFDSSDAIVVPPVPAPTPTSTPIPAPTPTPIPAPTLTSDVGKLNIITNPSGATVSINGLSFWTTPMNEVSLNEGTYTIGLSLSGYKSHEETVILANSETKTILWVFVPDESKSQILTPTPNPTPAQAPIPTPENKGKLEILTNPSGAAVTIDGVSQGTTPINEFSMDAGTHTVDLYFSGYNPHKETINLANSETKTILWDFVPDASQSPTPASTHEVTPKPTQAPTKTSAYYKTQTTSKTITDTISTTSTTNTDSALIYASLKSKVKAYHAAGCRYVSRIKPENLISFKSRKDAEAAGYRPCEVCGG